MVKKRGRRMVRGCFLGNLTIHGAHNLAAAWLKAVHGRRANERDRLISHGWEDASTQRDRELGFTTRLAEVAPLVAARARGRELQHGTGRRGRGRGLGGGGAPAHVLTCLPPSGPTYASSSPTIKWPIPVMGTLRKRIRPERAGEVSVVGYDDVPAAGWPAYDLTTVRQPRRTHGGRNSGPAAETGGGRGHPAAQCRGRWAADPARLGPDTEGWDRT